MVARFVRCVTLVLLALEERGASAEEGVKAGGGSPAEVGVRFELVDDISLVGLSVRGEEVKATFFDGVMLGN